MYNRFMTTNYREYTDRFTDFSKKRISDFILYNCGIEYCTPGYSYGPKRRDYHFIHFVKEGKGILEINNEQLNVIANQLFIVPENTVCTYTASEEFPWKYSWIGFTGIESRNLVQTLIQSGESEYILKCTDASIYEKKIIKILEQIHDTPASYFRINSIMYDIIASLLDESSVKSSSAYTASPSFQAMRYMDLHYHDDIQISDIAHSIGVHPNYLSVLFKNEIGISPKRYLTNLKINKAKKLLQENDDPINIVSSSVGITDPLSFSNFFRKETGLSPTDYRKEFNSHEQHDQI